MEAQYTDAELEQLLQGLDALPPYPPDEIGFSPALFTMNSGQPSSYIPPLPPIEESSTPRAQITEIESNEMELKDMHKRIELLETEIEWLKSTVKHLKSYLTNLHLWTVEATEALDKLGEAPASATALEFTLEEA